jgi:transcriptional regulator with XRE-family HTH domain
MMRVMPKLTAVVASNVRAERRRRSWRQADLGRRIGWSISQVSALETGGRGLQLEDLPLLCEAFRLPLARLLAHADENDLAALQIGQECGAGRTQSGPRATHLRDHQHGAAARPAPAGGHHR